MVKLPPIRVAQLSSSPGPAGVGGLTLPCRKLVLEYCDRMGSAVGVCDFARSGRLHAFGERYPSVEMVLQEKVNKHPVLHGFYANGRTKGISLRNLTANEIEGKFELLLDSTGRKLLNLKHRNVVAGSHSARGIWSQLHVPKKWSD